MSFFGSSLRSCSTTLRFNLIAAPGTVSLGLGRATVPHPTQTKSRSVSPIATFKNTSDSTSASSSRRSSLTSTRSINSVRVETGSIPDTGVNVDLLKTPSGSPNLSPIATSPLSLPLIAGTAILDTIAIPPLDEPLNLDGPLKTPFNKLLRAQSVSSMLVETGNDSDDDTRGEAIELDDDDGKVFEVENEKLESVAEGSKESEEQKIEEERRMEERKEEATKASIDRYENETEDEIPPPPIAKTTPVFSTYSTSEPIVMSLPESKAEETPSATEEDFDLDDYAYGTPPTSAGIANRPGISSLVRCGTCSQAVELAVLGDHSCLPTSPGASENGRLNGGMRGLSSSFPEDVEEIEPSIYDSIFTDDEPIRRGPIIRTNYGIDSDDEGGGGWATVHRS